MSKHLIGLGFVLNGGKVVRISKKGLTIEYPNGTIKLLSLAEAEALV